MKLKQDHQFVLGQTHCITKCIQPAVCRAGKQITEYLPELYAGTIIDISADIRRPFRLYGSRDLYLRIATAVTARRDAFLPFNELIDGIV